MSTTTYDITDEQWERIKGMSPLERTEKPGRPCGTSNRSVLNGGLWIGCVCQYKSTTNIKIFLQHRLPLNGI